MKLADGECYLWSFGEAKKYDMKLTHGEGYLEAED